MKNPNPYLQQVHNTLPRILALYDTDPTSPTYGVGDRYRWGWKLIDFGNGTFQGAAHGLARLLVHDLLPEEMSEASVLNRVDAMFRGAEALRYSNGSLAEAFPYESSFCVTALVAYDLLTAIELLEGRIEEKKRGYYLDIVRPMIDFLHRSDESHAFISNHLATAAASLYKWTMLTGKPGEERGKLFINRILNGQSGEGWFREYEGADPGYQSLCTYYMADISRMRPDLNLIGPLRGSLQFLWYFAHPDGSFGGHYGSRNTRFYYPAGIEMLADQIEEAAVLADFMCRSISNRTTVSLDAIDEPNLIPMFNAYCWAATLFENRNGNTRKNMLNLPSLSKDIWRRQFPHAGLIVDKGENYYTVISWHKGGVCYHFSEEKSFINAGLVAQYNNRTYYSTQAYQPDNDLKLADDTVVITTHLVAMNKRLPTPLQFIMLRLLNITLMRSIAIGNWIKKMLVRMLITGKKIASVRNKRTIHLGPVIAINDCLLENSGRFTVLDKIKHFSSLHMASQGYWQIQDDKE